MGNFLKNVVITGGAGTLGKALTKRLLEKRWLESITILSRDEKKHEEMREEVTDDRVAFRIGDIKDFEALLDCFQGKDTIIHAAASKRVCNGEENPDQYIANNVIGTQNVLKACRYANVERALFVSTDKSVEPINLYGATKLIGERLWRDYQRKFPNNAFSIVRYGNVFSSNGSIFDKWLKDKEAEHKCADVTRFWLSPQQAAELCFFALDNMKGGEVFMRPGFSCSLKDLHDELFPSKDVKPFYIDDSEKEHEKLYREEGQLRGVDDYLIQIPSCFDDCVKYWNSKGAKIYENMKDLTSKSHAEGIENLAAEVAEMRETIWENHQ